MCYYIPTISFYSYVHKNQISEVRYESLDSQHKKYQKAKSRYRKDFLSGKVRHYFRNSSCEIIKEITPNEISSYRKKIWKYRIKGKINRNVKKLLEHI